MTYTNGLYVWPHVSYTVTEDSGLLFNDDSLKGRLVINSTGAAFRF